MRPKVSQIGRCAFLLSALAAGLFFAGAPNPASGFPGNLLNALPNPLESTVRESIPLAENLRQLGLDLRLMGGQREQNGIFISDEALMRNIDGPNELFTRQNSEAVADFFRLLYDGSNRKKQTYLALIPTSGGVLQQHLPRFAGSTMVNQQRLIEELYSRVTPEGVRTVDVYSALYNRRSQYIYYRTENNLSALGGYYAYAAIAQRLRFGNRSLSNYEVEYADLSYYGDLYRAADSASWRDYATAPYRNIKPDTLAVYHYSQGKREYTVTHRSGGERKTYHTLFPEHLTQLGSRMDIYLGGASAVTEIRSSMQGGSLLVFGDKTAFAYLPFLINHYQRVTLVNLYLASEEEIAALRPDLYDDTLFAYSIETYIHTNNPARVSGIDWYEAFPDELP